MVLRWVFDGSSKDLGGFCLFSSNLCRPPPASPFPFSHSIPHSAHRIPHSMDTAAPKTLHACCGANTTPSRPGAGNSIGIPARRPNFTAEPIVLKRAVNAKAPRGKDAKNREMARERQV
jgi:hypothetical protein